MCDQISMILNDKVGNSILNVSIDSIGWIDLLNSMAYD